MSFDHPEFFFLLLLLVPLIWMRHIRRGRGATVSFALSNWKGGRFSAPLTWQALVDGFLALCFWAGFIFIILAFAMPVQVRRDRVYLNRGVDMMIVLDCSPSMAAQDTTTQSRFEHAKTTIKDFVAQRTNDAIGLVAFGAEAMLRVPPTTDLSGFMRALDGLNIMDAGDGTAIGLGLALAGIHLESSGSDRKAIVLLTDGENNIGEITPQVASGIVKGMGIHVYAIGIGRNGDVPLEYTDPHTGKLYRGTYSGKLDEELLKQIAQSTGGHYYPATSAGTLERIFQSIDSLEKVENRVRIDVVENSLVWLFTLIGLVLILADLVLRRFFIKELV